MMWRLPVFLGPSLLLLLPAVAFAVYAQWKVRSTCAPHARVESGGHITAQSTATRLLEGAAIRDVAIERTTRRLSDHYNPRRKVLRLSAPGSSSIAAIDVGALREAAIVSEEEIGAVREVLFAAAAMAALQLVMLLSVGRRQ